ncbi:unnamed protein product [Protopolystoma xenopodis]|uniref:Uncharacterized protein n=1 Tax=Protopolystoma xenopodis TaxID=117903 RepID=A0A448X0K4_9PLAT|nr:unnamed protein product [Protopolystoma xenopodis]
MRKNSRGERLDTNRSQNRRKGTEPRTADLGRCLGPTLRLSTVTRLQADKPLELLLLRHSTPVHRLQKSCR